MIRISVCFLFFLASVISPVAFHQYGLAASVPEIELDSENMEETKDTERVTIIGCDNSVWEAAAISAGQNDLAGTWLGEELNRAGDWTVTFTYSGRFEMKGPEGEWHEGRYACDGRKNPKILNLYIKESGDSSLVGQTLLMIYRVDSGALTCASSRPGAKARPAGFAPEDGVRIFVVNKKS